MHSLLGCSQLCDLKMKRDSQDQQLITSLTSADTDLSAGRRLGSSSRMRFLKVMEGWMSCSGAEVSPLPADTGIQLARPALVLRSVRLRGGLFRISRSEPRLASSTLFCDWPRSSGLFHTPSVTCLHIQEEYKRLQYTQDSVKVLDCVREATKKLQQQIRQTDRRTCILDSFAENAVRTYPILFG